MSALKTRSAAVFEPFSRPSRYKAAHGGRGSGKSQEFGGNLIEDSVAEKGLLSVCIREVQKSLKDSAKRLLESKLVEYGLGEADGFKIFQNEIQTPGDGVIIFQGMQDHTAESIKSLEGFKRAWVEEAQTLSSKSLELLRPTIRAPGSELWFSWNPRLKSDPVDKMFRGPELPTDAVVVRANWNDNPWFPAELEQERLDCMRSNPDQYAHIWEGDYVTVADGAYFARDLAKAREENRITTLAVDPLMSIRAYWDIGVRDATAIWIVQQTGQRVNFIDYYEASGQPLAGHLSWLRKYEGVECVLPHDGAQHDAVTATRFEDHIAQAGFAVRTVKNQGKGAAMKRVEAARRLFNRFWFDAGNCSAGLDALGWYHERKDETRNIGLGPEHDWASHGADAFGLAAVDYEEPTTPVKLNFGSGSGSWMQT
jgi:phage terminase large subunit